VILFAELGDKTQLAVLALAGKTKKWKQLFLGVVLAFAVTDGLAIAFGSLLTKLVPIEYIKIASGIIFIVFGVLLFLNSKEGTTKLKIGNPFVSGFVLVFFSEMGDKTQIASALFATQFNPILVFVGVILALALLSAVAIFIGKKLLSKFDPKTISRAAAVMFIVLGILAFL